MGAQMNIKNAEAVELAAELAKAEGISQTELVLEALRAWKAHRESESVYLKALEICRDAAPRLPDTVLSLPMATCSMTITVCRHDRRYVRHRRHVAA